jgi:PAS domain S-box-containing protein
MIDLKKEINDLCCRLGEGSRYTLDHEPAQAEESSTSRLPGEEGEGLAPMESVLCTDELKRRPRRPPDYQVETRALTALVQALADSPSTILQTLADTVVDVLRADSAGLSLLTRDGKRFYWAAIAGAWAPHRGGGTPRDFGPCGDVINCNAPLLFTHWENRYPYLAAATPLAEEGLLVPFYVGGRAAGTVWAIAHQATRRFDGEDLRLLESLGHFASAAYQAVESLGDREQRRAALSLMEDAIQARQSIAESESRFRQLADAMPQIVWTARPDGNIDYLNHRWSEFTGLPQEVGNDAWGPLLHPDDAPSASERWAASVRSGAPFEMELRLLDRREQTYRWHLIRTVAVLNDDGTVARWFGTSTDIHGQKRAVESSRFLAEASAELAGVVDYESTLQKVANLAVPYFADWSAVDLADEDGNLRRLAVAHQDPQKIALVQTLMRDYRPDPQSSVGVYAVLRTGKPELVCEIADDLLVQQAKDERHLQLIRSLNLKSFICVPLVISGKTLGLLTFATAESGRKYTEADLALAMDLAHRAAIAIENTQLYQALRETDRRKDEFLATLAHELRNPLAPVRNALQILGMPRVDSQTAERSREMMERQVQHLVRLVDDLMDVSRVMRGKIELRRERVELATIVARAVETVQPLVDTQGHQLNVRMPSDSLLIDADPVRLAQIVSNLLTNAAKYTEPGGHIWLTADRDGDMAVLRVRDNGIGISPPMLPRIFELFVQVDHASTKAQGGLGIGLTLVKNLVEMHNGIVQARSDGLGHGSEFIVKLPLVIPAVDPCGASDAGPQADEGPKPSGKRLLVVDDNQDAANSLAMLLKLQGHEVRVAYSGMAALEMTKTYTPHVMFLDIGMPGMDGYEVARRIRQSPGLENLVLAALTGWGQQEDRRRTAEAGFNHHLVKPPEPDVLKRLLLH